MVQPGFLTPLPEALAGVQRPVVGLECQGYLCVSVNPASALVIGGQVAVDEAQHAFQSPEVVLVPFEDGRDEERAGLEVEVGVSADECAGSQIELGLNPRAS